MKPFTQYLQEMNRLYEFNIKLAGCDYNTEMQSKLKNALEIYAVETVGKAKSLPIQEHIDFPGQGACECHMVDVALKYPVVTDQLQQVIAEKLGIPRQRVLVRTKKQSENAEPMPEPKKAKDGSVLNNPDLEAADGAQLLVGEKRKESMLKELESRKYEFAADAPMTKSTVINQGNTSPVGSTQNTIPNLRKGK
jgi:hypothetical protein